MSSGEGRQTIWPAKSSLPGAVLVCRLTGMVKVTIHSKGEDASRKGCKGRKGRRGEMVPWTVGDSLPVNGLWPSKTRTYLFPFDLCGLVNVGSGKPVIV